MHGLKTRLKTLTAAACGLVLSATAFGAGSCPWDLDGDGVVATADLLDLLGQWMTDPGGPPDFNGDGNVATADLLILLGAWGPCPK